jgi:MFS family permease
MTATPNAEAAGKRNVLLLMAAQALLFINNTTMVAVHGLVGLLLAPSVALATLPVTCYVIGSALATAPIARVMKQHGRKVGFTVGAVFGLAGVLFCAAGAYFKVFAVLCLGAGLVGVYNACGQLYRFAAADVAAPGFKERAISLVLAGGIVGGIVGPNLASYSKDWLAVTYAGSYLSLVVPSLLTLWVLQMISFPVQSAAERAAGGRPLLEIMRQPVFVIACLGAVVGYGVMNLLMTATPIAMKTCGFTFSDSAHVLTMHVVGMFLPSFFTGSLIRRFGVLTIMFTGAMLMFACVGIALSGVQIHHFFIALMTLGVGWNFLFIGGTTLLTEAYRPEEKTKTQGANDFMIFLTMATSSFSSGALVTSEGWDILNYGALPFLVIVSCAIAWLARARRLPAAIA